MEPLFDVNDKNSWYFGPISRKAAIKLLQNERESGVFLIRDCSSSAGNYVLSVREENKISNYIIKKIQEQEKILYRMGEQTFESIPKILTFYTMHYLDTAPIRRPLKKNFERVIGIFDFIGKDADDLSFKSGEVLTIISKNEDEEQWWLAKNALGKFGLIPVPYVKKYEEFTEELDNMEPSCSTSVSVVKESTGTSIASSENTARSRSASNENKSKKFNINQKLPALARVIKTRHPNAYDQTALKLEIGDIIKVTKANISGEWEGEFKGKTGHFPFTYVEFIDENKISNVPITDERIKKE